MTDPSDTYIDALIETLAPAAKSFIRGPFRADDEFGHGADDIIALRKEYGEKLLRLRAENEALELERDQLQKQVRKMTRTLRKVYEAEESLREALRLQ